MTFIRLNSVSVDCPILGPEPNFNASLVVTKVRAEPAVEGSWPQSLIWADKVTIIENKPPKADVDQLCVFSDES